ncbi:MAG: hypothetical protein R2749_07420 [Acidimicrobiales bacterium]
MKRAALSAAALSMAPALGERGWLAKMPMARPSSRASAVTIDGAQARPSSSTLASSANAVMRARMS